MNRTSSTRRSFLKTLAAGAVVPSFMGRMEGLERALAGPAGGRAFRAADADTVAALGAQYMLRDGLTYLNHASIGTVPRPVHDAHVGYLELCESHPHVYVWEHVWRDVTEETRAAAARLLRCDAEDVAITHSTTEGFNVLAHGLALGPGDEVLFSTLNHASASGPWDGLAQRRGFAVRRFPFPVERGPELTEDEVVALHVDAIGPATRVLVFPHVDNAIGVRHPMARLAREARARGVRWIFVDGAQSAGMIPLDLRASGVDAYAMSPHKWIQSPKGLGLFWTTPALRDAVPRMWMKGARPGPGARAYEDYSTRAWPAVVALGDALAFQAALGEEEKERRYRALWSTLRERVTSDPGLIWHAPSTWSLGSMLVSVEVRGQAAPELGPRLLEEHHIGVRAFGPPLNALRIAPNVATSDQELERALDVLSSLGR